MGSCLWRPTCVMQCSSELLKYAVLFLPRSFSEVSVNTNFTWLDLECDSLTALHEINGTFKNTCSFSMPQDSFCVKIRFNALCWGFPASHRPGRGECLEDRVFVKIWDYCGHSPPGMNDLIQFVSLSVIDVLHIDYLYLVNSVSFGVYDSLTSCRTIIFEDKIELCLAQISNPCPNNLKALPSYGHVRWSHQSRI